MAGELFRESEALRNVLRSTLGWTYDMELMGGAELDDEDEDGPVLVENPEDFVSI